MIDLSRFQDRHFDIKTFTQDSVHFPWVFRHISSKSCKDISQQPGTCYAKENLLQLNVFIVKYIYKYIYMCIFIYSMYLSIYWSVFLIDIQYHTVWKSNYATSNNFSAIINSAMYDISSMACSATGREGSTKDGHLGWGTGSTWKKGIKSLGYATYGWDQWSVVTNFPKLRIHNYISYTYQILNLGVMRLRIDMAMINGYQFSAITYSQLHQLYLSNSDPRYHEVENWYGYDQWWSIFRHHVFTTTSAIPNKFSTTVSWGWELVWLWTVVINFPPSRIHSYISYTYQILNLGVMRLRNDMATISGYQFSAITCSQPHQLYLSNSQPRYHEVENWYGYDEWLSIFRHHVFTTTSAIPIKFSTSVSWGWDLIWLWSVVVHFPPSRIHDYISYTYQILNLGIMRLRIDMAMISSCQWSAITYSQLHQLYLSNSQPRCHEVKNWYGYDQWWSIFRHHVFTTTSAIPIKFWPSVSWGWELIWLWSVVINFPPSRIHNYISYTYQLLNLGLMRLRIDMAMINGYQFSAITYSQLHQLYLSNSDPRYHEVENWYGYDQWWSIFRHHVFTTTSAIPNKFSTTVSWGWELVWLWTVVINFPPSRIHSYISYTYQILNLGVMRLRNDMATISGYQFSAITCSQPHQLYLSNSQPRYHEVENWYGYDQ